MKKETICIAGKLIEKATVFGFYTRFIITVLFPQGTLTTEMVDRLNKSPYSADVSRFSDDSGYVTIAELIGKSASEYTVNDELSTLCAALDTVMHLPDGTCRSRAHTLIGTDDERWDRLMTHQSQMIIHRSKLASLIRNKANDNSFACPICGAKVFNSTQTCRHDIVVDGKNNFLDDVGVSSADDPDGAFITCVRCGAEIGDKLPKEGDEVKVTYSDYLNLGTMDELRLAYVPSLMEELEATNFNSLFSRASSMSSDEKNTLWDKVKNAGADINNVEFGILED